VIRNLYSALTIDSSTPTSTPNLKKHPSVNNKTKYSGVHKKLRMF
jgi:hypothetical protein